MSGFVDYKLTTYLIFIFIGLSRCLSMDRQLARYTKQTEDKPNASITRGCTFSKKTRLVCTGNLKHNTIRRKGRNPAFFESRETAPFSRIWLSFLNEYDNKTVKMTDKSRWLCSLDSRQPPRCNWNTILAVFFYSNNLFFCNEMNSLEDLENYVPIVT